MCLVLASELLITFRLAAALTKVGRCVSATRRGTCFMKKVAANECAHSTKACQISCVVRPVDILT